MRNEHYNFWFWIILFYCITSACVMVIYGFMERIKPMDDEDDDDVQR